MSVSQLFNGSKNVPGNEVSNRRWFFTKPPTPPAPGLFIGGGAVFGRFEKKFKPAVYFTFSAGRVTARRCSVRFKARRTFRKRRTVRV